jgi:hypothetical protein
MNLEELIKCAKILLALLLNLLNMNKLLMLCLAILLFIQCEKQNDTEYICERNDWIGTFQGEGSCFGKTEVIKLIFTKGIEPDDIIITNGTEVKTAKYENCMIQLSEDTPFFSFPVTGTAQLRGDTLDVKASTLFGISCSTTIVRQ